MQNLLSETKKTCSQEKIDAMFLTNLTNIQYLSGFTGTYASMLITKNRLFFFTDRRYLEYARKNLPKEISIMDSTKYMGGDAWKIFLKKQKIKKLGFEGNDMTYIRHEKLKKHIKPVQTKSIDDFVERFRIIKQKNELEKLIRAQRIAEKVLEELKSLLKLKTGITEKQIAWEIEKKGHEYGADTISFTPIIGFGNHSAIPHHQNTDRKFKKGDIVLIDMGMKYQGYCSDMTRIFFTKKPSLFEQKIYSIVLEAQEKPIQKMKPGMTGSEIDAIARNIITKGGYAKNFTHSLGHGIGLEVHESPNLSIYNKKTLPAGTVITSEPGIYLEGKFGIRIEDMVILERNGTQNITKAPKKLEQICIK